jgi:arsenic resistance protein ArsH
MTDLSNIDKELFQKPSLDEFQNITLQSHPPKILLLYGSLRERSFSRLLAEEAERILKVMGCETRFFNPHGLPQVDDAPETHPKVAELRDLVQWSEGMVWSSPERHGAMTELIYQT